MSLENQLLVTIPISLVSYGEQKIPTFESVKEWTGFRSEKVSDLLESVPVKFEISAPLHWITKFYFHYQLKKLQDLGVKIYLDKDSPVSTSELNYLLVEANDETTSIERLTQIFQSYCYLLRSGLNEEIILKAIVSNPNTPWELLNILGKLLSRSIFRQQCFRFIFTC